VTARRFATAQHPVLVNHLVALTLSRFDGRHRSQDSLLQITAKALCSQTSDLLPLYRPRLRPAGLEGHAALQVVPQQPYLQIQPRAGNGDSADLGVEDDPRSH